MELKGGGWGMYFEEDEGGREEGDGDGMEDNLG